MLEKLTEEVDKLHALLHDEDGRGMMTWKMFLHERLQNLSGLLVEMQYVKPVEKTTDA